ncbi:MAG: tyrosine--tRNA ligase [Clostridia bacterium]|nr:tyrosine--tRNA ligase [Clostridia bacterium]
MNNVYDVLSERGYIAQCSHPEELRELLGKEKITFYIGYDPTADSLHIGHYVALMTMAYMQREGHTPIVLLGAGTAMIGDPSGKTDMRRMLTEEELDHNAACFQTQMSRLLDFSNGRAIVANNAEWLRPLNFMEFMRDIGSLFSVNRMLAADCYKQRMERGLTFFEMGYMLLQSYDFLELNRRYGCVLQMGGDDQWSNILSGADLIRRKEQKPAFALTNQLLLTHEGKKMGKTEKGALWLDKTKTPVYDFYQYWRNVDDADVETCLRLLTFIPMEEIKGMVAEGGAALNEAKRTLAYTLTAQVHGEEEAAKAQKAAEALFGGGGDMEHVPTVKLTAADVEATGLRVVDLLVVSKLCPSKSEARRMIQGGGVSVDDEKIEDVAACVDAAKLADGMLLKKGKKGFVRIMGA